MKVRTISVHSSRGGTGKTLIATNLAVILARKGFNVALLDLDFRAPSLANIFSRDIKVPTKCWLNDFLDGKCSAKQVLSEVSFNPNLKGKLLVGLANPSIEAIQNSMQASLAWEVSAAKKLFSMLSSFYGEMNINYCIFDTSPGIQYSSINALFSSDLSIIVTTADSLDLEGSQKMLNEIFTALEKKAVILINKFSPESRVDSTGKMCLVNEVEKILRRPVIGEIPCYCDVLQAERKTLLAIEKPDHPFVRKLEEVVDKLVNPLVA